MGEFDTKELFAGLNPMQREAVTHTEGPLLILAGAGSGKTTVLVNRIAYLLLEKQVRPYNILAITFTNKAANEMKTRVARLFDESANDIWVSTFHSMCVKILRRYITRLGYDSSFVIYDSADSQMVIKDCLKQLNLSDKNFAPRSVLAHISNAKDDLLGPQEFEKIYAGDFRMSKIAQLYISYQNILKANNALDFDDIIVNTVRLFEENPDALEYYQKKFRYIMVDEYQDTNNAQYRLISLLSAAHRNLCVVGDDDQSIYKFRGANIRNILDFEKEFPDAKVIKLEQNYRSTQTILNAANDVIAHNRKRKGKNLWTEGAEGDKIYFYDAENEHDEGRFIAREIDRLVSESARQFSDFVILYRTNAQSRVLEEMLLKQGIPYRVLAGLRFYDRKEIKDIIAYLRVIHNPSDSVSLKRIINEPKRGIGATTVGYAQDIADSLGTSIYDVIKEANLYSELLRASVKLNDFTNMIDLLRRSQPEMRLTDFVDLVLDKTGYRQSLMLENSIEAQSRMENLDEFMSVVKEYEASAEEPSLSDFLENVSLISDIDNYDEDQPAVTLMTIHSAKGLEFPVVFLAGMEEGLFPGTRSMVDEEEIEEERRLCYVAITRAKENLYITKAQARMIFGQTTYPRVSRFVQEIPQDLLFEFGGRKKKNVQAVSLNGAERSRILKNTIAQFTNATKSSLFESFDVRKTSGNGGKLDYVEGDTVMHKKFGRGKVLSITPLGNDHKVQIQFENGETKNLMAMFANLKKV
ncbi:MAG TPA: DNA helicase PcrA [Candidatus Aphodoplasma excrementigallinarum]|uniref:ATP-dependent DNA helicase n=1 Tax=Candidatus Aphodoplasma excrementigallinarum TaxID=2840673 RepID=A0A9D1NIW6_9FIRM|nr:DNA helicase PcrA [Candidatus Aphodoplasma excrementigallinarum]